MRCLYCIWAAALVLWVPDGAAAQQAVSTSYTVFLRGAPIGREEVSVQVRPDGTTIVSEGRLSAPLDIIIRRAEFSYRADWSPDSFMLDADVAGGDVLLRTSFANGMAITEGTQAGKPFKASQAVSAQPIVHANSVFGSYAALARRLATATAGTQFRIYIVPQGEITVRVQSAGATRMQIANTPLDVRRYELVFANPAGDLGVNLTAAADDATLLRLSVPAQALDVLRVDLASTTSRTEIFTNPTDEAITIPVEGFNLGATITRPKGTTAARAPAVILLSGPTAPDREGFALGTPIFGQLAGALADAGFFVVRYDKRGFGQSGGRFESATLPDYADDARAVMRWLSRRKDVDPDRIALVGHGEGAWVALTAARERRFAAVVTLAGPSTKGAELILEQQQLALDQLNLAPVEEEKRVALQKQIQAAVLTGKGWESLPPEIRKQADTPWFQSLLLFDPVKTLDDVRQPLLVVHGELDRQIPVAHADRLADLARKESRSKTIELVIVRGVNHLLVPADASSISADVTRAVSDFLAKTFKAVR